MTKLKGLPIPLPPSNEQTRIVETLEKQLTDLNALECAAQISRQRASILRQATLSAFLGKLVSQNPNDEPASLLLERVRNERAAASAKKNGNQHATMEAKAIRKQRWRHSKKLAQRDKVGKALP